MSDNSSSLEQLIVKAKNLTTRFNVTSLKQKLEDLEKKTLEPNFWQTLQAQSTMEQLASYKEELTHLDTLTNSMNDARTILDLMQESQIEDNPEITAEFVEIKHKLQALVKTMEIRQYLSGQYDRFGCYFSLHPGQGGTEAMDWAQILERMYLKFFEKKGWKFHLISKIAGEEAGIKQAEYEVIAPFAYGLLKKERGTHRLVRLSPFNADSLRQTSFALVEITPIIPDETNVINIKDDELEWKFSRSGGAGGQNVNKVNTAVELKHKPSGTVVHCREERSQVQNKQRALSKLKSLLAQQMEEKHLEKLNHEKGEHVNASWGHQIRNYVLHPYKLIKDTRTGVETSQVDSVLAGDLDQFIEAELAI